MPIARTLDDLKIVATRLDAGLASLGVSAPPHDPLALMVGVQRGDRIFVLGAGGSGVIAANFDNAKNDVVPAWWVGQVYGLTQATWRAMLRELNAEFITRGHGPTRVRWTDAGPVAALMKTLFGITPNARGFYEFTPNQAVGKI